MHDNWCLRHQVPDSRRWRWDLRQLLASPLVRVSLNDIELDALAYEGCTTWTAGGGTRANQKLDGLTWAALAAFAETFDIKCDKCLVATMTTHARPNKHCGCLVAAATHAREAQGPGVGELGRSAFHLTALPLQPRQLPV